MKKLLIVALMVIVFSISGCVTQMESLKEVSFDQGCYASSVDMELGYVGQGGSGEACKIKCSKELAPDYCYKYENQRTGCSGKVGTCE